jgi:hypothetical protein
MAGAIRVHAIQEYTSAMGGDVLKKLLLAVGASGS